MFHEKYEKRQSSSAEPYDSGYTLLFLCPHSFQENLSILVKLASTRQIQ